jgi:hypothetical protein
MRLAFVVAMLFTVAGCATGIADGERTHRCTRRPARSVPGGEPGSVPDGDFPEQLQFVQDFPGAERHAGKRVLGNGDREVRFLA